jgi:hypothetical protein
MTTSRLPRRFDVLHVRRVPAGLPGRITNSGCGLKVAMSEDTQSAITRVSGTADILTARPPEGRLETPPTPSVV